MGDLFERWYRRFGPRYPRLVLAAALRLEYLVVALGAASLAFFFEMSWGQVVLLAVAAVAAQEFYALLTLRYFRRRQEPLAAWIAGPRTEEATVAAWRAAASAPYQLLRLWWRGGYPLVAGLAWCLFATWLLDLQAWGIPVLYATVVVLLAYGNGMAFLIFERALQPVLDDIATHLSDEVEIDAVTLPLRRRLLSSVPAISVGVGVAVAGFAGGGDQGLGGLISIVGISLVVALTFSLAFTLLLADSVVLPIRRLETATARVGSGDLGIRVPVSSADETGTLTRAFNRMVAGLQERERLREAFGTFVDPGLADRVARDGTDVRGEELEVSILFMDVRGFTSYSESAPAREVVARLNELYEVVVPVITGHGGHANKFIGDGLLAVFGAPERHADHADRAVAAGLEIAQRVGKAFHGALRVGLGINSGTVVVGTIGGGGRLDFTVIGDTVNTAARVESATRQTGDDVLITEATRSRLGSTQAAWGERPAIPLKGKSEEIRLFAPVDGTTLPSPTE
jgi:adenylate cyclase